MSLFTRVTALILLIFTLTPFFIFAQSKQGTGNISGKVKSADGSPIDFAVISIKGVRRTTVNENGAFFMRNIPAGTYIITASIVGFQGKSLDVVVKSGETVAVEFTLSENNQQLDEIVVNGRAAKKLVQRETESASRMPIKNLENPQVYNVVGQALIKEQMVTDRNEIYVNIPGAVPNFSAGGSQGISQRGFLNTNGMRNGLTPNAIYPMNAAIIERVEVMKGPSGTLFGTGRATTFGGVFNYVTKRPFSQNVIDVSAAAGSYGFFRGTADVNQVLNEKGTQLLRVNAAWQSENSFQSEGFSKNWVFAPTFSLQVNERLKMLFDVAVTKSNYTTVSFTIPSDLSKATKLTARNFKDLPMSYNQFLGDDDVDSKVGVVDIGAEAEYKLSDTWKSQTKFLFSEGKYDRLLWGVFNILEDAKIARAVRNQDPETFGNFQLQQNFIGDFKIGNFRNRIVAGVDFNRNYNALNRVTIAYDQVDLNQAIPAFNRETVNAKSANGAWSSSTFTGTNYSAYISDVFNITPGLMAMLSLRGEYYKTEGAYSLATKSYTGGYDQDALSPKVGLVYQPIKDKLTIFGNYMNGFTFQEPRQLAVNAAPSAVKPQFGTQLEGGVKFSLLKDKISGSVSHYTIKVTNSIRTEGGISIQDGTQRSEGYEFDITANPINGLNVIAGFAHNQNKYITGSSATVGKLVTASPENVVNLWASYAILKGSFNGLGFGAGGNYVSNAWFDAANQFVLPSYTLLNGTVYYSRSKYRLGVKLNNILDERYWNSTGMPQKSRYFVTELRYRF
jgi:iron complex outermembrane recepter protein